MSKQWKPRASSLGYYLQCTYRAAFDAAIKLGLMPEPEEVAEKKDAPKPAADLGTCIHWYLQAGVNCQFPKPDPMEYKFTEDQLQCASTMFDNDREETLRVIDQVARLASGSLPKAVDGKPWLAEIGYTSPLLSGHIDFLSQDYTEIIDLKTTGKKPRYNRIKPEHLGQIMGYAHLVKHNTGVMPQQANVLYVDSRGKWVAMSEPILFEEPGITKFFKQVEDYLVLLNNVEKLFQFATPQLGGACYDGFCPHTASCRDCIIPKAAKPLEAAPPISANVFGD